MKACIRKELISEGIFIRCKPVDKPRNLTGAFIDSHHENGDLLKAEAAADLVGVRLALSYAKRLGYQDLEPLFGSFARLYAQTSDPAMAMTTLMIDTHPAQYLRVNVNAQMMDEFYETYGVKEGDNMYVAPESRIRIWGADAT